MSESSLVPKRRTGTAAFCSSTADLLLTLFLGSLCAGHARQTGPLWDSAYYVSNSARGNLLAATLQHHVRFATDKL